MTRHRVPNHVLDGEDDDICIHSGVLCLLEKGHEGDCDLRAPAMEKALDPNGPATGQERPEAPREPTIRELAEIDAVTLPPHQRPAAIERMVAERTSAAVQRAIAEVMEGEVAWHPKVRVEIPANLRPQETNVYLDNVKLSGVVAVRVQTRPNGEQDTYVVLRVRDAEVKMAEGFADLEFGRLDLSVRHVKGFDVGTSMDSRQPYDAEDLKDRARRFGQRG